MEKKVKVTVRRLNRLEWGNNLGDPEYWATWDDHRHSLHSAPFRDARGLWKAAMEQIGERYGEDSDG